MKMSNRTKDIIFFLFWIFVIAFTIFALGFAVGKSFAEPIKSLTETEQINKFYTEETIKNEMYFLAMWEYTENMSEQEYYDTFYKNDCAEYEYVMKKEKEEVKKCQKN